MNFARGIVKSVLELKVTTFDAANASSAIKTSKTGSQTFNEDFSEDISENDFSKHILESKLIYAVSNAIHNELNL